MNKEVPRGVSVLLFILYSLNSDSQKLASAKQAAVSKNDSFCMIQLTKAPSLIGRGFICCLEEGAGIIPVKIRRLTAL